MLGTLFNVVKNKQLRKLVILINLLLCLLFLNVFFLGLKEWISQLFIQNDAKMWLDWQITFLQVLISLSGALSISLFFLLSAYKFRLFKRLYYFFIYLLIISCLAYSVLFIGVLYINGVLLRFSLSHIHIFVPFLISLIAILFKNYWRKSYEWIKNTKNQTQKNLRLNFHEHKNSKAYVNFLFTLHIAWLKN